jgi:GGDEF domain-containing protein
MADSAIPISISFGVASNEDGALKTPDILIKAADSELYKMKAKRE